MQISKANITWLAVLLLIIAAGIGTWLWQKAEHDDQITKLNNRLSYYEQSGDAEDCAVPSLSESSEDSSQDAQDQSAANCDQEAIVVFDPAGLFDTALKTQINQNVIEPFSLYQDDLNQPVAAFHVQTAQVENQYTVTAIMKDGSYSGVLIGGDQGISWTPTCMDECQFSDAFKAKYPDIVTNSSN